jgi:hypothetical protein
MGCWPRMLAVYILCKHKCATLNNLNKQYVFHHPHTMALPSGIYTIVNVRYRNWVMLSNANEGDVVAGSSAGANVGEKVGTSEI